MIPIGILNSGLSIAQSKVSLKKPAFTVELTNSKVEMVISYALFPLASGVGYLMPETTEGLSTAVARGSLSEIGASTRYAGSMLTEAEAEAQRAEPNVAKRVCLCY
jgi:hypothetical protein